MGYQDLLKDTSAPDPNDKNAFLVTIEDLNPDITYPLEFRWKFKDGTFGKDWSPVYELSTGSENSLLAPHFTISDVTGGSGFIAITWDGKDSGGVNDLKNFDRVDIYIKDYATNTVTTFGDGTKPTAFFKQKGTKTIVAPAGKYVVKLRTVGASGKTSALVPSVTNDYTVTVTSGLTIEDPTLPTGLSVSAVPFGIAVNWSGAYTGSSFFGFQSINIYATTTDYGATTSSTNITSTKLVGAMTVNDTANKITVGLDALRTALSLSANKDCYTTNTYFYYIATNLNGVKYKSGGAEVYTRINSTPIKPTQANFIDLANGVISIENLVAGNGSFTSWLRTGTAGSSRIELSSTSVLAADAGGYAVLPGLTVYNSGNSPIFRADLAGNVSFGGYTPTDIASISTAANKGVSDAALASAAAQTASTLAGTKNKIFVQTSTPSAIAAGDVWVNTFAGTTADGYLGNYTNYVASASGSASWTAVSSVDAKTALGKIVGFNSDGSIFNKALQVQAGSGSIYSNRSSYEVDENGWYLGYMTNTSKAAIALGGADSNIKWDPDNGLRVKGNIYAVNGTFSGNITSTATITGGSVYGATLGTSNDTSIKRITIPSSGNVIQFQAGSGDTDYQGTVLNVEGKIYMDTTMSATALGISTTAPGLRIEPPSASSYTGKSYMTMINTPAGGITTIRGTVTEISGWLRAIGQPDSTLMAVRNIKAWNGAPGSGDGVPGDIWFQY